MNLRSALAREAFPIALSAVSAVGATIVWAVLTVETGLTFHLFPLLIVVAPAFVLALTATNVTRAWLAAVLFGVPAVAAGWLYLEASGNTPTATFVRGQPGGVLSEVVLFAALGVIAAPRLLRFVQEKDE